MAKRRAHGEGSIHQRHKPDCRRKTGAKTCTCPWLAVLDYGIGGKRDRRTRTATTRGEAVRLLDDLRIAKTRGVVPSAATLDQWLTYWLDEILAHDTTIKASTRVYYKAYVDNWLVPVLGKVRLDKLGPDHIRLLHSRMRAAGKSPTTIRNAHATLRRALVAAFAERRIQVNWAKEVGGVAAADNPHPVLALHDAGNVFVVASRDARELARAHVALLCGLRQGEALALRWEDVTGETIHVGWTATRIDSKLTRTLPKTKRSVRTIPIPEAAKHSLAAWRKVSGGKGYVFHGFDGPDSIEAASRDHRAWRRLLTDAEVPIIPLHGARGTCATMLRSLGHHERVIADFLGQADVRVLLEHYLHSDERERSEAVATLGQAFDVGRMIET